MTLLPPQIADALNLPEGYSAAKEVAKIQKAVFPVFKEQGFTSKGRCFNKVGPDGTIRVIHFLTMPATSSEYGKFSVEIGVYIPEVWMFLHGSYGVKTPKSFDIGDCEVRIAADPLGPKARYQYWEALAHPELTTSLRETLDEQATKFYDRFSDRAAIMQELEKNDASVPWIHDRAPILLAIIESQLGRKQSALQRLEAYLEFVLAQKPVHRGHASYVRDLIARF